MQSVVGDSAGGDFIGSGIEQRRGARGQGGAGGHDIVDQEQLPAQHALSRQESERIFDICGSLLRREVNLWWRPADASQDIEHRDGVHGAHFSSQEQRLVESTLAQSR